MNLLELMNKHGLVTEGGAGGHMKHPYERYQTPEELLKFFNDFLSGNLGGTEKVDGYNLFVGYDNNGNVVAVRNKNHEPIKNITKKFNLTHGAFEGFNAGWKAIKSKFDQLSKEERKEFGLISENGKPLNFINLEILFGYIPNVVPYSKTKNFIVFHNLAGSPENNWNSPDIENEKNMLKRLANVFSTVSVHGPRIKFTGEPGEVDMEKEFVNSFWQFKGPIEINKEDIKKDLKNVIDEWQSFPEVQKLRNFTKKKVPPKDSEAYKEYDDERFKLMKSVTKRIGSEVLKNMVSKLSDTGYVVAGHPGMEGIALDIEGDLIKITGDFLDFNKPDEIPNVDATKKIREYIQKDVLGLTVTTLSSLKDKSVKGLIDFVLNRRKKKYSYDIDEPIGPRVKADIRTMIQESQQELKGALEIIRDKGREYDEKSLLIQSYLLSSFSKELEKVQTHEDLIVGYGKIFYNIKR
jgi:hypothetical protein